MIKIAPSILAADFARLGEVVKTVEQAGVDMLHIDIMDGHFVPNLTIGPAVVKSLRPLSRLWFDVHLMVSEPAIMIQPFIDAGADSLTVHVEATSHLHRLIQEIHRQGAKAAAALNPATPLALVEEVLEDVDMVLLMTVNPGFGGQKYISTVTDKIKRLKNLLTARRLSVPIQVDGGIDEHTAKVAVKAGAEVLVAGSFIFGHPMPAVAIDSLRQAVTG